jgi:hypothetical protein
VTLKAPLTITRTVAGAPLLAAEEILNINLDDDERRWCVARLDRMIELFLRQEYGAFADFCHQYAHASFERQRNFNSAADRAHEDEA